MSDCCVAHRIAGWSTQPCAGVNPDEVGRILTECDAEVGFIDGHGIGWGFGNGGNGYGIGHKYGLGYGDGFTIDHSFGNTNGDGISK